MADNTLTKDARGLVSEVVTYLKRDWQSSTVVPRVQTLLSRVTAQAKKEKTAIVTTSVALSEAEKKTLTQILSKIMGHDMEIENTVADDVIGGMRIQVGDWVVDTTLESQLTRLGATLTAQ